MKLRNKTNRMVAIPLPHQIYCKALGRCVCIQLANMKGKVASSLTIAAGATSKELPDAILKVPQVARMLKQQKLAVEKTQAVTNDAEAKPRKSKKRQKGSAKTPAASESSKARN